MAATWEEIQRNLAPTPPGVHETVVAYLQKELPGCAVHWTDDSTILVARMDGDEGGTGWVEITPGDRQPWRMSLYAPADLVGDVPLADDLALDADDLARKARVLLFQPLGD